MSVAYIPACRFCDQLLETGKIFTSQEEAEEYATRRCLCVQGQAYNMEMEDKEKRGEELQEAQRQLEELLTVSVAGMRPLDISDDVQMLLYQMAEKIYDDDLMECTVKLTHGTKLKIGKTSKNNLMLARSDAAVFRREV